MGKKVWLRRQPLGALMEPGDEASEEVMLAYPAGMLIRAELRNFRSRAHHGFVFAFLSEVYAKWPKDHDFQPRDEDHLRGWLIFEAGFIDEQEISFADELAPMDLAYLVRTLVAILDVTIKTYYNLEVRNGKLVYQKPKSIAFERMHEAEFRELTQAMFLVIYQHTGLDADQHWQAWQDRQPDLSVAGRGRRKRNVK